MCRGTSHNLQSGRYVLLRRGRGETLYVYAQEDETQSGLQRLHVARVISCTVNEIRTPARRAYIRLGGDSGREKFICATQRLSCTSVEKYLSLSFSLCVWRRKVFICLCRKEGDIY